MCLLKVLAITNELGIMGFKATLHLCQEDPGKRVPMASSGDRRGVVMANHA